MREERSRLRTQVYILEKERVTNEAQQKTSAAHLKLLQNQLVTSLNYNKKIVFELISAYIF